MKHYDYLVVGAGLAGATTANLLAKAGKSILIIDKRPHIAGNTYTSKEASGELIHQYGSHIFHTHNKEVWDYVNEFEDFIEYKHHVVAENDGIKYPLPLNKSLFETIHGEGSFANLQSIINKETEGLDLDKSTAEGFAISKVGTSVYEKVIKHYTEKQWGRKASELPASIVKRLVISDNESTDYFPDTDKYQGLPVSGYTQLVRNMLDNDNIDLVLKADFFNERSYLPSIADNIIYTGPIDQFFDYSKGKLDYRSLQFMYTSVVESNDHPVINDTGDNACTRVHDWKAYYGEGKGERIVTYEYPREYTGYNEPYYPINDTKNNSIYKEYAKLAKELTNVYMIGRLAEYKYLDMDDVIGRAMKLVDKILK